MKAARIKRRASFKATVEFTAEEWSTLWPWDSVNAVIAQGSRRTTLAIAIDAANRILTLTATPAQTGQWITQPGGAVPARFDIWVTRGVEKLPIPASQNIPLTIIEGVTEQ